MDTSLSQIWRSWNAFVAGKNKTLELETFCYYLEENLAKLQSDIEAGNYKHGPYRNFVVCDNKRREIKVASIRDRVVHRLLYDYLVEIYDKTFIFDAWSCRKNKGLLACIERAQMFMRKNSDSFVWRTDIKKFFDNIDRNVVFEILQRKVKDEKVLNLLSEVIGVKRPKAASSLSLSRIRLRRKEYQLVTLPVKYWQMFI
jgi:RNA-directed DNA polymerase